MQQNELNRAVARATGETVSLVKRIGFLVDDPDTQHLDPDDEAQGPHVIDWDDLAVSAFNYREPFGATA